MATTTLKWQFALASLRAALRALDPVLPRKPALDGLKHVLKHVLLEPVPHCASRVFLSATNLDTRVRVEIATQCEAPAHAVAIDGERLQSVIQGLNRLDHESVCLSLSPESATITVASKNFKARLRTVPADDFPSPAFDIGALPITPDAAAVQPGSRASFSVKANELLLAIQHCRYAIRSDSQLRAVRGLCLQSSPDAAYVTCVGCDGHRLAVYNLPIATDIVRQDEISMTLSLDSVQMMMRCLADAGDATVFVGISQQAVFVLPGIVLWASLVDEPYMDWRRVLPSDNPRCFSVNRVEFLEAVKRMRPLVDAKALEGVVISVDGKTLKLQSDCASDLLELNDPATEKLMFRMNPAYLCDMLQALDGSSDVACHAKSQAMPVLFESGSQSWHGKHLIMSMRL